eukprot:1822493-Rhodomonas_salina.1
MWLRDGKYMSHAFLPCESPSLTKTPVSPLGPSSSVLLEGNLVLYGGVGQDVVGVDNVERC